MNKDFKYLPKSDRKKILLISDDLRAHSGVGNVARDIVLKTCQHFNWVNIAGAQKHQEAGKRLAMDDDMSRVSGVSDPSVILYPSNGYGDPHFLRQIINIEKPDAIMLITDPRYFIWLFNMESEIRKNIPIAYLNIWDCLPSPAYNSAFYESCDLLMGISKQTKNINKMELKRVGVEVIDLDEK